MKIWNKKNIRREVGAHVVTLKALKEIIKKFGWPAVVDQLSAFLNS